MIVQGYEFPDDATPEEIEAALASEQSGESGGALEGLLGLLPAAGATAGGIAGGLGGSVFGLGVGGVPGAMGGSALGAAGGEAIRQLLARGLGYEAPESAGDAAGMIAGEGGLAGLLGGGIGGAAKGVAGGVRLASKNPQLAKAFGRFAARRATGGIGDAAELIGEVAKARSAAAAAKPATQYPIGKGTRFQPKPKPGKTTQPKAEAKAPVPHNPRTASLPELQRRWDMLWKDHPNPPVPRPVKYPIGRSTRFQPKPKSAPADALSLEELLRRSIEAEKVLKAHNATPAQRSEFLALLRKEGGRIP